MTRAIGAPLSDAERIAFIAAARSMLGTRWRHQGRDTRGVDCAGLVAYSLRAVGRTIADSTAYGRVPYRGSLEATLGANLGPMLKAEDMRVGDVALMVFDNAPHHVGVVADYKYGGFSLVHAYAANKQVVEMRIDDDWRNRIIGVYRP